jgi:ribosomal protein S27AE
MFIALHGSRYTCGDTIAEIVNCLIQDGVINNPEDLIDEDIDFYTIGDNKLVIRVKVSEPEYIIE